MKHKHEFIRTGTEHIGKSLYEYFVCQCTQHRVRVDGKLQRKPKKATVSVKRAIAL